MKSGQIGDALFLALKNWNENSNTPDSERFSKLMQGGEYENGKGNKREFKGLLSALNYYIYARLVKYNNFSLTRFGFVEKQDHYSQKADIQDRLVMEKDARSVADTYMTECLEYLETNKESFHEFSNGKQKNRLRISIIGD